MKSKIIKSLREDMTVLHEAGVIDEVALRQFDAPSSATVRDFSAAEIKRLRAALNISQADLARHLHITSSTVRRWEQGASQPAGAALKLLNIIADKGIQAII